MKKLFPILLFICCSLTSLMSKATTVTGRVYDYCINGFANQKVYIRDSVSHLSYFDSALTNASGAYSFTLPAGTATGDTFYVWSEHYGRSVPYTLFYAGSNFTGKDFEYDTVGNVLKGYVHLPGTTTRHRAAKVYVISDQRFYDTLAATYYTMLTLKDSISVDDSGFFRKVYGSGFAPGYYLKAVLDPADSEYANYLPTYYDTALLWSAAKMGPGSGVECSFPRVDIYMQHGVNPGGPGFIGGSVLLGANKSTGTGDPLSKRIIILTNATTGKAVAYRFSDASGKFSFSNLAYGTYNLFGDVWGKTNPSLTVTISASNSSISNVVFKENRRDFTGQIIDLGVSGTNPLLAGISAYPNPAKDYVEVGGLSAVSGVKTIILSAMNGAVLAKQNVVAAQTARISTASLPAGIYMLHVQTDEGSVQLKVVK